MLAAVGVAASVAVGVAVAVASLQVRRLDAPHAFEVIFAGIYLVHSHKQ